MTVIREGSGWGRVIAKLDGHKVVEGDSMFGDVVVHIDGDLIREGTSWTGDVIANLDGNDIRKGRSSWGEVLCKIEDEQIVTGSNWSGSFNIDGAASNVQKAALAVAALILTGQLTAASSDSEESEEFCPNSTNGESPDRDSDSSERSEGCGGCTTVLVLSLLVGALFYVRPDVLTHIQSVFHSITGNTNNVLRRTDSTPVSQSPEQNNRGANISTRDQQSMRYRVVNVSRDDHLNVRSGPSVSTSVVGRLSWNETNILVLGKAVANGPDKWLPVSTGVGRGWVHSAYLEVQVSDNVLRKVSGTLNERELENACAEYYNSKGEWAGKFRIWRVTRTEIQNHGNGKLTVHVEYEYARTTDWRIEGVDRRRFELGITPDGRWVVTSMGKSMSARF